MEFSVSATNVQKYKEDLYMFKMLNLWILWSVEDTNINLLCCLMVPGLSKDIQCHVWL